MTTTTLTIPRIFDRPRSASGIWSWIGTVDHKRIGTLYGITAFLWFLVGGIEALLIRTQLATADSTLIDPDTFNQLFTMHGTTMVFLVVMPLSASFFNWFVPLQIGARDVAFPRLNALSFWLFLFGGLLLNVGWFTGDSPSGGWFGYAPNSGITFNTGSGMTFWAIGLSVLGVASIAAGLNFVVTIFNMRAPGMTMFKLPVFTWMTLITSILLVLAIPVIGVALIQIGSDRLYGTNFYNSLGGGDPVLWQHMFWLFGHPEVYILILPAMGIVSEIIPTFSRKPLFGYPFVIFSGISIAFLGWFVWSHHMFTVGLGPAATSAFAISTMAIAIPTGVKILNWMATMVRGSIQINTPMLFAISFIAMFTIGGLSGVMHAAAPSDAQQQDTYFVVAHFHYVLFGGSLMGIFSGIYYWWPKMTGWMLNDKIGIVMWFFTLLGFNLQFAPLHWLGLDGMPRRIFTYSSDQGWESLNAIASVGGYIIALAILIFLFNIWYSRRNKVMAGNDPWNARTLEWSIPSPPPHFNFAEIPQVQYRDDFWYQKYPEQHEEGHVHAIAPSGAQDDDDMMFDPETGAAPSGGAEDGHHDDHGGHGIHLPDMSYYPIMLAAGITLGMGGLMAGNWVIVLGGVIGMWGLIGWSLEPVNDPAPDVEH
ncbi:MAG: cytochrome c oxidase subunit I [Chloroflexi bacterium]|nr:cytochrome c oxidase subunit I [Chloroflexota bacterium]